MKLSRIAVLAAVIVTGTAPLHATDVDLRFGIRSFFGERWPEVGAAVAFGRDDRPLRPAMGVALASDAIFGGVVFEGSAGIAGTLPRRGRVATSWGAGAAWLDFEIGANRGTAVAGYAEIGVFGVRDDGADLGVVARFLGGGDVSLTTAYFEDPPFRKSLSTLVVSFVMRW